MITLILLIISSHFANADYDVATAPPETRALITSDRFRTMFDQMVLVDANVGQTLYIAGTSQQRLAGAYWIYVSLHRRPTSTCTGALTDESFAVNLIGKVSQAAGGLAVSALYPEPPVGFP